MEAFQMVSQCKSLWGDWKGTISSMTTVWKGSLSCKGYPPRRKLYCVPPTATPCYVSYLEVDPFSSSETRWRISDNLFRLASFRAHLVLFSVQKSVVTNAILSLNDWSFSKSHSNCKNEDKSTSWRYIHLFMPCKYLIQLLEISRWNLSNSYRKQLFDKLVLSRADCDWLKTVCVYFHFY